MSEQVLLTVTPPDPGLPTGGTTKVKIRNLKKVGIRWSMPSDPDEDIVHFEVQRDTTIAFNSANLDIEIVFGTAKKWDIASNDLTTYYMRVRSVSATGNTSAWLNDNGTYTGSPAGTTQEKPVGVDIALSSDLNEVSGISTLTGNFANGSSGTRWEIKSTTANTVKGYLSHVDLTEPALIVVSDGGPGGPAAGISAITLSPPARVSDDPASLALRNGGDVLWNANEFQLQGGWQARGYCAVQAKAANATDDFGNGVTYGGVSRLVNTPSSITLTTVGSDTNTNSSNVTAVADSITNRGFRIRARSLGTGQMNADRTYVTVGN